MSADEVRYEMIRSLAEWGVRPTSNPEHRAFYDMAVASSLEYFHGTESKDQSPRKDSQPMRDSSFPTDTTSAIKHILRSELTEAGNNNNITLDRLLLQKLEDGTTRIRKNLVLGHPPFFFDQRARTYRMKREYNRFTRLQMDPLNRFITGTVCPATYFYHCWFDTEGGVMGLAFEAIVACHVIKASEPCLSCKRRDTIRWTGGRGSASSWMDMSCSACQSTYEIKSKKTPEHINRDFQFNGIRGGSFYLYHSSNRSICIRGKSELNAKETKPKRFLVLVSRTALWRPTGEAVWPVEVAEIDYIVPRLKDKSFGLRSGKLSVGSDIRTKLSTRKNWFQIPMVKCDFEDMAREVYNEHFSSAEWIEQQAKFSSGLVFEEIILSSKITAEKELKPNEVASPEDTAKGGITISTMKKELESVMLGMNDWEDLDSD